jgi:hypothetical protein
VLAQEESRLLNHNHIGTEHILLGLIQERDGIAAKALLSQGISLEKVRAQAEEIVGRGGQAPSGHIPFTPRAKTVLELSLREALQLGHNYIGTEHILLGLIREGEGVGVQVINDLGADLTRVRREVIQLLSGHTGPAMAATVASDRTAPYCSFCNRDLREVDHYVGGRAAAICDACIDAAHTALDAAPDDRKLLSLPPRVFGTPPADDPRSVAKITQTLTAVFGPELSEEAAAFVENGELLVPILMGQRERFPDTHVSEVVVARVRFSKPEAASVAFALVLDTAEQLWFVGTVVRAGEGWLVTTMTFAEVLSAGEGRPPPET